MGRPRKKGNKDLPTGLYRDSATGVFYIKWKGKQASLGTSDKKTALEIFAHTRARWEQVNFQKQVERVATRLNRVSRAGNDEPIFTNYCRDWRENVLPSTLHRRTKKPLSEKTRADYARMLRNQVEPSELLSIPITEITPTLVRQFLSPWFGTSPSHYNNLVAVLGQVFRHAYRTGTINTNPMKDVDGDDEPMRYVYVSDKDYVATVNQLPEEWHRRACDLVYLVSHRPGDVLGLRESNITGNEIHFTARKNDQDMAIEFEPGDDMDLTIQWFRDWKRKQHIYLSPYLICYPRNMDRRFIGRRVSVGYLSRLFTEAVKDARVRVMNETTGAFVRPTLRDLRPKALTDEYVVAGDSDKGGHKTEAMKRHYRRKRLPMRAKNRLSTPRSQ